MYLLTHSLSPVLVLVAVMDPKVLKTKISHTHSLILSLLCVSLSVMRLTFVAFRWLASRAGPRMI